MWVQRVIRVAIQHGLRHLSGLERHAQQTNDPHPEHRAWSTESNRNGHARDVPQTNRRRQSSRQCLKVADRARRVIMIILSADQPHTMGQ